VKDAFIGVMCLILLVDFVGRIRDIPTSWLAVAFNGFLLAWGLISIWKG
jgi:hypothetical protein